MSIETEMYVSVILLVVACSLFPLRFTLRKRSMENLAKELNLKFRSDESPSFRSLFFRRWLGWERRIREVNHIEGMYMGHKVHIFDRVHFAFWGDPYRCFIEIDDVILNNDGTKNFHWTDYILDRAQANYLYPLSVTKIRAVIHSLK